MIPALDIVCSLIIIIVLIRAYTRGFIMEFSSWAAVILGFSAAALFSGVIAQYLALWNESPFWNQIIAFLGLFIITYLIVKLFETGLQRIIEKTNLQNLDKALGLILGLLESTIFIFIFFFILQIQPFFPVSDLLSMSFFGRIFIPLFPFAADLLEQIVYV